MPHKSLKLKAVCGPRHCHGDTSFTCGVLLRVFNCVFVCAHTYVYVQVPVSTEDGNGPHSLNCRRLWAAWQTCWKLNADPPLKRHGVLLSNSHLFKGYCLVFINHLHLKKCIQSNLKRNSRNLFCFRIPYIQHRTAMLSRFSSPAPVPVPP